MHVRDVCDYHSGSDNQGSGQLVLKAVAPRRLVKVWLLWLKAIFRPEMAGGDLGINPGGLAAE